MVPNAMHAGMENYKYNEFMRFMHTNSDGDFKNENSQQPTKSWIDDFEKAAAAQTTEKSAEKSDPLLANDQDSDWVRDFAEHKAKQGAQQFRGKVKQIPSKLIKPKFTFVTVFSIDVNNEEFNKQFWNRLQDEWKKISDGLDEQSPWLAEFSEYYDPYTVI